MNELPRLLRNWNKIAKIPCTYVKDALAMTPDPQEQRRLQIAYPECFREGKLGETDLFSWKRILEYAEYADAQNNCEPPPYRRLPFCWMQHIAKDSPFYKYDPPEDLAGIPVFASWLIDKRQKVSAVFRDQFRAMRGKRLKGPMFLQYKKVRCVVGFIWFDISQSIMPSIGEIFNESDRSLECLTDLILVRADLIRFDC